MAAGTLNSFMPDALDANRRGELTDRQRQGFRALSWDNRKSALSSAALLVAGAVLVLLFASPTAPPVARVVMPAIALAIAAFLIVRAIVGTDALTRDLRAPHVESVEGAIGKRSVGGGRARGVCFLDVGDRSFTVAHATYSAAPDHGFVRLYFLPRSKKIVNFERLPDPPVPDMPNVRDVLDAASAALRAPTRRERNEAHAVIGSIGDALEASFSSSFTSAPKPAENSPPLADAIIGTWRNPMMTVTFSAAGRVTVQMLGGTRSGRWSVDGAGRLQSDVTGRQETTDAWVTADQLTISVQGESMTLQRA